MWERLKMGPPPSCTHVGLDDDTHGAKFAQRPLHHLPATDCLDLHCRSGAAELERALHFVVKTKATEWFNPAVRVIGSAIVAATPRSCDFCAARVPHIGLLQGLVSGVLRMTWAMAAYCAARATASRQ